MRKSNYLFRREGLPNVSILLVCHLLFMPLFVLSFIYFKERLFGDSAWFLFRVINSGHFVIEHSRPSLYLWEWFILLLVKTDAGLGLILKAYSVYHVAFFYLAFVYVVHVLKDFRSGLFILCFQFLGISDMFFCWPMWEMFYGLIGLAIQIALWRRGRSSFIADLILTIFIFMSYPYNIIIWVATVLTVFPWEYKWNYRWRLSALLLSGLLLKLIWGLGDKYESGTLSNMLSNDLISKLLIISERNYILTFLYFYFSHYTLVFLCIALSIWMLRRQKYRLTAFLMMIMGFTFVINLAYGVNEFGSYAAAFEARYYIIPVFTLLMVVYNFNGWKTQMEKLALLIFLLFVSLYGTLNIIRVADVYHERVLFMERGISFARRSGNSKLLYDDENIRRFNYHYCMFSIPMESMLISACDGGKKCVTISEEHMLDSSISWKSIKPDQYMMMNGQIFDISSLNKKYFLLTPQAYWYMNNKNCGGNTIALGLKGTAVYDHRFNTDYRSHLVYSVDLKLPPGVELCSRDSGIYWQVETGKGVQVTSVYGRQPLSIDARQEINDLVIISRDSLGLTGKNYICLIKNAQHIAKIPIP